MELYTNYPKITAILCFLEIMVYAGQLFGWSSVLFVLKEEGFYMDKCVVNEGSNVHPATEPCSATSALEGSLQNGGPSFAVGIQSLSKIDANDTKLISHNNAITDNSPGSVQALYPCGYDTDGSSSIHEPSIDQISNGQIDTINRTKQINNENFKNVNGDRNWKTTKHGFKRLKGCDLQETSLNLCFSIAICVSYVLCSVMGPLLRKTGMRRFRTLSILTYCCGALCLGFATPEYPWLITCGLCGIGVSGMALYATNVQVSFLFPSFQSTITSVFVGLFDVSTVVPYFMKIGYQSGFSRKYFYVSAAAFHVVLVGLTTFVFLPMKTVKPSTGHHSDDTKDFNKEITIQSEPVEKKAFVQHSKKKDRWWQVLLKSLRSLEFTLHVYWMCCQSVRFITFLGFFNTWIEDRFNGHEIKESYYLGLFSWVTLATCVTALTAGMLHDCQRRKYLNKGEYHRKRLPIILPLTVTSLLSVAVTALTFVPDDIVLNFIFILFTIFRSYMFSYEITFLNDIYPFSSFPVLFGVLHASAGLAGMLQYPLFEWYQYSKHAPFQVNILILGLAVTSLAHPGYIWYRCRRHKTRRSSMFQATEICI